MLAGTAEPGGREGGGLVGLQGFHEFHQKPTTLDGDGIVISTAHLMSEQWHVSAISVKYREKTKTHV